MARGTSKTPPTPPISSLLSIALIVVGGGILAAVIGAAEAVVLGIAAIEVIHQRRVERFNQRLDVLEDRLAQGQDRIYYLSAHTKEEIYALAQLERRRIHVERRVNGTEPSGPQRLN